MYHWNIIRRWWLPFCQFTTLLLPCNYFLFPFVVSCCFWRWNRTVCIKSLIISHRFSFLPGVCRRNWLHRHVYVNNRYGQRYETRTPNRGNLILPQSISHRTRIKENYSHIRPISARAVLFCIRLCRVLIDRRRYREVAQHLPSVFFVTAAPRLLPAKSAASLFLQIDVVL